MTKEEFRNLRPGKSIVKTAIDGVEKILLFKYFLCYTEEDFDGYWMLCTENIETKLPLEREDSDLETYADLCDVVSF